MEGSWSSKIWVVGDEGLGNSGGCGNKVCLIWIRSLFEVFLSRGGVLEGEGSDFCRREFLDERLVWGFG